MAQVYKLNQYDSSPDGAPAGAAQAAQPLVPSVASRPPSALRSVALAYRSNDLVERVSLTSLGVRSIIDAEMQVAGDIASGSSVAIKGGLDGSLQVTGDSGLVVILPGAQVRGKIRARFVWIAGHHEGRLECQRLLMLPGGVFRGDCTFETIEVKHGADFLPATTAKVEFDRSA